MNNSIKAGDLVMIVKPCCYCGDSQDIGLIFRVDKLYLSHSPACCCEHPTQLELCAKADSVSYGYSVDMLKRIDPLREPESIDTHDEVPA